MSAVLFDDSPLILSKGLSLNLGLVGVPGLAGQQALGLLSSSSQH